MIRNTSVFILALCPALVAKGNPPSLETTLDELAADLAAVQSEVSSASSPKGEPFRYPGALKRVQLTAKSTAVYKGADAASPVLTELADGEDLPVVDSTPGWYAVELPSKVSGLETGWVSVGSVVPRLEYSADSDFTTRMYEKIVDKVQTVKAKYEENPHVGISGFTVEIGIPPSVSIDFEFK